MPLPLTSTILVAAALILAQGETWLADALMACAIGNEGMRAALALPRPRPTTPVQERQRTPFVAPEEE